MRNPSLPMSLFIAQTASTAEIEGHAAPAFRFDAALNAFSDVQQPQDCSLESREQIAELIN